uniref:OSJNBa0072D08.11 protein n=1 Tax=Oryza sativa subsp. japonica TaxID=39947 RepID=Q7XWQ2_ORYSJ|nr:OSJNBa0072D08.11 [Oryza sativa Japonica Group]
MDLDKSTSTTTSLKKLQDDDALPGCGTMERESGGSHRDFIYAGTPSDGCHRAACGSSGGGVAKGGRRQGGIRHCFCYCHDEWQQRSEEREEVLLHAWDSSEGACPIGLGRVSPASATAKAGDAWRKDARSRRPGRRRRRRANERADKLACDLAEVLEDLQKMRELVAGNERQRQGLEHRMSELENNLSEIRGSLRVTYTGLHQLARECGVTTTIPENPDEFSLTSSLAELATAMEEIPSKHAARIGEETSNGIYTGACHILACVRLTHPDLDLRRILDQGAANDAHKGVMEEVGDLGESILPLFQEDVDVEDVQQRGQPETSVIVPALVLEPYVPQDDVDQRLSMGADMAMTSLEEQLDLVISVLGRPRERVGRSRSSNPVLKDEVRGGRTREDYGGSEEGAGRGSSPRSRRCGSTRTSRVAARRWLKSTGSSEYLTGIPRSRRPDTSMKVH